jgi:hypothetical protein
MGDVKLLPCPFCGSRECVSLRTDERVSCQGCGTRGPRPTGVADWEGVTAWNTRPASALTPAQQAAEEMAKALERIASDFEMDFVLDGHVVDGPSTSHIEAWKAARNALAKAGKP